MKQELHLTAFHRVSAQVINDATKEKRLQRAKALLHRFKVHDRKCLFFTDKKNFYLNPLVSYQNDRVWTCGKKASIKQSRLLVECEKFVKHVTVLTGVCFGGKGRLHFVEEKAKVDCAYYVGYLLSNLVENCNCLLPTGFIFQQDGAPAHTARSTQNWLQANSVSYTHLTLPTILRA